MLHSVDASGQVANVVCCCHAKEEKSFIIVFAGKPDAGDNHHTSTIANIASGELRLVDSSRKLTITPSSFSAENAQLQTNT